MEKDLQTQLDELVGQMGDVKYQFNNHNHDNTNSFWIQPENLFIFSSLSSDATVAPTDTPSNGTVRVLYDNNGNYVQWERINKTWVGIELHTVALPLTTADLTAQSAAVSSVVTTTAPNDGVAHQYDIGGYITITAISVNTISLQVTYTDETSTSRTQSFFPQGLTSAAIATTGAFAFPPMTIRAKQNTTITVKTVTIGAGSQTYDVGGNIQRIN